jgi:hypothetical protein
MGVQIGFGMHTPVAGAGFCYGAFAGYGVDWEAASFGVRASGCRAVYEGDANGSIDEATLAARLTKSLDVSRISPFAGIEVGAGLFHETYTLASTGAGFDLTAEAGAAMYLFGFDTRALFALRPALGVSKTW